MEEIGFLFDLDGVLIDSEKEYTRIWKAIDTKYPTGIKDFAHIIKGQTLTRILSENFEESDREPVKEMLHSMEREMKYQYCDGAEKLLTQLVEQNRKIALVTSSDEVKMAHLYEDLPDFKQRIHVVIDSSKVTRSKPDPEGYLKGANEIGIEITKCVVFEDSVEGVKAGRAAGAYTIGIAGTKKREDLLPFSDEVIDSLEEIELEELSAKIRTR